MDRRKFLKIGSSGILAGSFGQSLYAQSAIPSDYKALVCIFLLGGNDGNNTVIPSETEPYKVYAATRSVESGINVAQSALLPFKAGSMSAPMGLHPMLKGVHSLAENGKLAVVANVGPLIRPISKAEFLAYKDLPDSLYSHINQQDQWQTAISDQASNLGWGGRMADAVAAMNGETPFPVVTAVGQSPLFTKGALQVPLTVPQLGGMGLSGFSSAAASVAARRAALDKLLRIDSGHALMRATGQRSRQAIDISLVVNPLLTSKTSMITGMFSANNPLAAQLSQVAKLIEGRAQIGLKRQIFFVALGGFDNHTNQLNAQGNLLTQVDAAMKAFYDATVALGVADNVTTFTLSDFGRTFKAAAGGASGSDHAWGNHQLILGGAVKGGIYGKMPTLELGGPDDVSKEGRWLPTTSVDQYAATLATWFGVAPTQLTSVVPNIGKFASDNLGFMS